MPPYASGLFTPSRPSLPSFANTSCAGNAVVALPAVDVRVELLRDELAHRPAKLLMFFGEPHCAEPHGQYSDLT